MVTLERELMAEEDVHDYILEELLEEVRRGEIPIYLALINLDRLSSIGITQRRGARKQLYGIAKMRMDKE